MYHILELLGYVQFSYTHNISRQTRKPYLNVAAQNAKLTVGKPCHHDCLAVRYVRMCEASLISSSIGYSMWTYRTHHYSRTGHRLKVKLRINNLQ